MHKCRDLKSGTLVKRCPSLTQGRHSLSLALNEKMIFLCSFFWCRHWPGLRLFFIPILFALTYMTAQGQVTLRVVIQNLKNDTGNILFEFMDGSGKQQKGFTENILNKECVITIGELKPGKYSFRYFHDENANKKMETYWIGAPKEGFGFSNNPMGRLMPPAFEDTVFDLKRDTTVVCKIHYIRF